MLGFGFGAGFESHSLPRAEHLSTPELLIGLFIPAYLPPVVCCGWAWLLGAVGTQQVVYPDS